MLIRHHVHIRSNAAAAWPFVADPSLPQEWKPAVSDVRRTASGPARLGERFTCMMTTWRRPAEQRASVVDCRNGERITFRFEEQRGDGSTRSIDVTYAARPTRCGIRLTQTINLAQAGIARGWLAVIWLITRFGRQTVQPPLHALRHRVERPPISAR